MPDEDIKRIYFGVTASHTRVYLGKTSALFAKWMYDKLDIEMLIEETDIITTGDAYTYLHNINATMFASSNNIAQQVKVLLNAYDIIRTNNFKLTDPKPGNFYMLDSFTMDDVVNVFYNHTKHMTIVVPGDIPIEGSSSTFITITRDFQWLDQIRLCRNNKTNFVAKLIEAIDKKVCDDFADAKKRMAVFKLDVPL